MEQKGAVVIDFADLKKTRRKENGNALKNENPLATFFARLVPGFTPRQQKIVKTVVKLATSENALIVEHTEDLYAPSGKLCVSFKNIRVEMSVESYLESQTFFIWIQVRKEGEMVFYAQFKRDEREPIPKEKNKGRVFVDLYGDWKPALMREQQNYERNLSKIKGV